MGIYDAEDGLTNGNRFEPDTANKLKHFLAMRQRAREKLHSNEIAKLTISKRAEVKRCVLDLKNPYVYDMQGRRYDDSEFCEATWHAQVGGHDGVIIRNTYDLSGISACETDLTA
jgi:superfamily I DNA and/or RNA helicase